MNEFRFDEKGLPRAEAPVDAMAEIYGLLGEMYRGGAMDEEGPFVTSLLNRVQRGEISPQEALTHVRAKAASRNDYH